MTRRRTVWSAFVMLVALASCSDPPVAGEPELLVKVSGDQQTGFTGQALAQPLRVRLTDAAGIAVSGAQVTWITTGAIPAGPVSTTNTNGEASMTFTLAAQVGTDTVVARADQDSVLFLLHAVGLVPIVAQVAVPANYGHHDTFVRDGLAFAALWNTGVVVYDVGNGMAGGTPAAPVPIDTIRTPSHGIGNGRSSHNTWWFHNGAERRYLFVGQEGPSNGSTASGDIYVVDVSDLQNPDTVAFYHMNGAGTHNFWMDEPAQVLYAAYYNGGVVALDVSGTLTGDLSSRELARNQIGGAGNTFTWGVQLSPNGFVYAIDMLSGLWQLNHTGASITVVGGGNNVSERYSSDLWVHGNHIYTGTWGTRGGNAGNALKIWRLNAGGTPQLVDSIITPGIGTVSDVQVSDDGALLVFSAENGPSHGLYVFDLTDPEKPRPVGRSAALSLHTATISDINGRRYVFAAKNPSSPAMIVFDITDF